MFLPGGYFFFFNLLGFDFWFVCFFFSNQSTCSKDKVFVDQFQGYRAEDCLFRAFLQSQEFSGCIDGSMRKKEIK